MTFPPELLRHCWFLVGPTACGKTALSLVLAERLNAEIVALDSMTLYRGMDIGTAKPSAADRAAVPHHLLDLVDPNQEYSIAEYLAAAHRTVAEKLVQDLGPTLQSLQKQKLADRAGSSGGSSRQ